MAIQAYLVVVEGTVMMVVVETVVVVVGTLAGTGVAAAGLLGR
jgi:hypothetical protein